MKLGNSVIITLSVRVLEESITFYDKLGFAKLSENEGGAVMADGQIRLSLQVGDFPSPVITYFTPDLKRTINNLRESGIAIAPGEGEQARVEEGGFRDIDGQHIMLMELEHDILKVPFQKAKCGIFGEYAIPVKDMKKALQFYKKIGFERVGGDDEKPYPWAIVKDSLIVVGLHQCTDFASPMITYFASDMADRIQVMKDEGLSLINEQSDKDGKTIHASLKSPDGQLISLYFAEGFEDGSNV